MSRTLTEVEDEAILDATDQWHACEHHNHPLYHSLGLSWAEYGTWVEHNTVPEGWTVDNLTPCEFCS